MTPDAILADLNESEGLPRDALRQAGERREEMVPVFLDAVGRATTAPVDELDGHAGIVFIFHLLGERDPGLTRRRGRRHGPSLPDFCPTRRLTRATRAAASSMQGGGREGGCDGGL